MHSDEIIIKKLIHGLKQLDEVVNSLCVIIKDLNSKSIFTTATFNLIFDSKKNLTRDFGLPKDFTINRLNQVIEEDKKVIQTKIMQKSFNMHFFNGEIKLYICYKYPIINFATNNVIAIYCTFQEIPFSSIHNQLLRGFKIFRSKIKTKNIENYNLTRREKQIIFLFLAGLSSNGIAKILSSIDGRIVSKNTIDSIFTRQLRPKFNVYTRQDLFTKLAELGFDRYIPMDLLMSIKLPLEDLQCY